MIPFIGFKKIDGVVDVPKIHSDIIRAINILSNGEYEIKISKKTKIRSVSQNRLLWLWYACIAETMTRYAPDRPTTKNDVHKFCGMMFLSETKLFGGKAFDSIKSTSELTTEEFTLYLNQIQAEMASEYGIVLPNPDDEYWIEFYEYFREFL